MERESDAEKQFFDVRETRHFISVFCHTIKCQGFCNNLKNACTTFFPSGFFSRNSNFTISDFFSLDEATTSYLGCTLYELNSSSTFVKFLRLQKYVRISCCMENHLLHRNERKSTNNYKVLLPCQICELSP